MMAGFYCESWYGLLTQAGQGPGRPAFKIVFHSQALTRYVIDSDFVPPVVGRRNGGQEHKSLVILWRDSCTGHLRNGES